MGASIKLRNATAESVVNTMLAIDRQAVLTEIRDLVPQICGMFAVEGKPLTLTELSQAIGCHAGERGTCAVAMWLKGHRHPDAKALAVLRALVHGDLGVFLQAPQRRLNSRRDFTISPTRSFTREITRRALQSDLPEGEIVEAFGVWAEAEQANCAWMQQDNPPDGIAVKRDVDGVYRFAQIADSRVSLYLYPMDTAEAVWGVTEDNGNTTFHPTQREAMLYVVDLFVDVKSRYTVRRNK